MGEVQRDYLAEELERVVAERDKYKAALVQLVTWEYAGRNGKKEMKRIAERALQEVDSDKRT